MLDSRTPRVQELSASDSARVAIAIQYGGRQVRLENTRWLRVHQLLELGQLLQAGEVRIAAQLLAVLETGLEGLANRLQRPVRVAPLRIKPRHEIKILGLVLDAALLQQNAGGALVLEHRRIQRQRLRVTLSRALHVVARKVRASQIAVNGG